MAEALKVYGWQRRLGDQQFAEYLRLQRVVDRELATILRDAAIEGERIVARLGALDNVSAKVRRAQYAQAVKALRASQAELWGEVTRSTQSGIARSTAIAVETEAELMSILTRAAPRSARGLASSMQAAARASAENVRSRVMNDVDLSPLVYKNRDLMAGKVARTVNRGLALNKSAKEIAKDVRQFIGPNVKGGVSYAANRLGRTEINNALHTTSIRIYDKHPWNEGVKWNLSGSHPVPDECNDYAEREMGMGPGIWKPSEVPFKPHPNCLCYTTVITPSDDVFIDRLLGGSYNDFLESEGLDTF